MKSSLVLLSLVALSGVVVTEMDRPPQVAQANTNANQVNKIAKATTVLVQGQNPGSGVIIDKKSDTYYVLTAKHVVETEDEYEVVTPDGQNYPLQNPRIERFSDLDLALVAFDSDRSYKTASLGLKPTVQEGDRIYVAGWPIAGKAIPHIYQMTSGEISGISPRSLSGGYQIVYTNVTRQGMSGGPIFNQKGQVVGIHGQAEGREIYLPDQDSTRVKAGFNLGIPIHQYVKNKKTAIAKLPTTTISAVPSPPPIKPPVVVPEPPLFETGSLPEPVVVAPEIPNPTITQPLPPQPISLPQPSKPSPITLAANPTSRVRFVQSPRLLSSTTTEKTTNQLGARYFFTIEVPENAGASLEQLDFKLNLGVQFPRFSTTATKVFAGKSKKGKKIPVKMVVTDPPSRTVSVTMAQPIKPGETATVMLKMVKNPSVGTYQYEIKGHPVDSQGAGQYIGLGRIEIRPVQKF